MCMSIISRRDLETVLRYVKPRNLEIYQDVFVHRSALRKLKRAPQQSNERLEFLGDVVLGLAVTDFLYDKYPLENEGFLTKLRIKIVKGTTLAFLAKNIGLEKHVAISSNTSVNGNILENTLEALIGAIYLDYRHIGYEMHFVKTFVFNLLDEYIDWENILMDDNFKDILMRHAQKIHVCLPSYKVTELSGTAHCPNYTVDLTMNDEKGVSFTVTQQAGTKRDAEQLCAKEMLSNLNVPGDQYIF
jgi:ribonuclease III